MKLTRKQELYLIDLGLSTLIDRSIPVTKAKPIVEKKSSWSAERRKKFSETMKKKWAGKAK